MQKRKFITNPTSILSALAQNTAARTAMPFATTVPMHGAFFGCLDQCRFVRRLQLGRVRPSLRYNQLLQMQNNRFITNEASTLSAFADKFAPITATTFANTKCFNAVGSTGATNVIFLFEWSAMAELAVLLHHGHGLPLWEVEFETVACYFGSSVVLLVFCFVFLASNMCGLYVLSWFASEKTCSLLVVRYSALLETSPAVVFLDACHVTQLARETLAPAIGVNGFALLETSPQSTTSQPLPKLAPVSTPIYYPTFLATTSCVGCFYCRCLMCF